MKKKILSVGLAWCMLVASATCVSAATVASGECGSNVEWVLDDSGTLTIDGTGNMNSEPFKTDIWNTYIANVNKLTNNVIIKNGITNISGGAFQRFGYMRSIEIPNSVTSIGNYGFQLCSSLYNIIIPESVTYIGKYAFYGCDSLRKINIPERVDYIGEWAFYDCSALTEICLPKNITAIGEYSFYNCKSLRIIYLPSGVTEIGENAFDECGNIKDIYFAGSAEEWSNINIGKGNAYLTGARIHYNNAEGEYPYEISSLSLRSNSGEYISALPENENCIVNVGVTERLSRAEHDYVFVALYDEAEQLVGINYIRADFSAAHGCEFGLNIPKQSANIGSIKAFIWSSFEDMMPLCEAKEIITG